MRTRRRQPSCHRARLWVSREARKRGFFHRDPRRRLNCLEPSRSAHLEYGPATVLSVLLSRSVKRSIRADDDLGRWIRTVVTVFEAVEERFAVTGAGRGQLEYGAAPSVFSALVVGGVTADIQVVP